MGRVTDLKAYGQMIGDLYTMLLTEVPAHRISEIRYEIEELFRPFLDKRFIEKEGR